MALNLIFTSHSSSPVLSKNLLNSPSSFPTPKFQSFSLFSPNPNPKLPPLRLRASPSGDTPTDDDRPTKITDEWGEKADPEPEPRSKLSESDPPQNEDEWGGGGDGVVEVGNGNAAKTEVAIEEKVDGKLSELKRGLVDTVYGTEFGFRAGSEVRAEALEFVSQLEAANPNPAPTENPGLLDGNWVLLYTASSELLPLLAAGGTPLLKVNKITQAINSSSLTILNSTTLSSPFASFSFSASASFEVRSPSRIQVEFKEGSFQPPEIKSSVDLPQEVEVFGQKINLSPVQQTLNPLQDAVAGISRTISGQPPLKVPVPGERTKSWLLITYLDEDLRISRGDGGLFVLAREGSPLLYQ
ncbi:plastoglobulin-1 [Pyrus ussuriensis x Pyrus communis]|uniref:Plastoglobulin-1 n=1 Tax=Pyrus ussuriensis x Pyrus communis TaxID=2448454 RepID=A0A5N5HZ68_9ROSA|nr:plastoglobulin-1 [Pyrus ussuriensis x Pyrus communis]